VVLLEAFQPSLFCFPLPYTFAAVYGCLIGCAFLWMAVNASASAGWGWMLGAGSAAAVALLLKPEFGIACYATLVLLIAMRGLAQHSWLSVARDTLMILPGVLSCVLVVWWMVSIGGFEFITQENILSWPTSYFMKTFGSMWLQENGFTLDLPALHFALWRAVPIAGFLTTLYSPLWKRVGSRAVLFRVAMAMAVIAYVIFSSYSSGPWPARLDLTLATIFFPQDMVLYVALATPVALFLFWRHRANAFGGNPAVLLLLAYSSLLAFRILMKMFPGFYPIYYNGPVVLSFLWLMCRMIPRATLSRRTVFVGELLICLMCVSVAGLYARRIEATAKDFVPLTTERGTIRAPQSRVENYKVAIQFMKEKAALGQSVLSVPEDTSLYFLSGTYCPTRVFSFTPGAVAPGIMTEKTIKEIDQKPVRYLLWSNRTFVEFGVPIFGRDFNQELGDYLKSHYQRVGSLTPAASTPMWDWSAAIWERKPEASSTP
jgi:hypothetical protein